MQKRIQQTGLALIAVCLFASCGLFKNNDNPDPVDNGSDPTEIERTVGTIRSTEDCGFYIEIVKGDLMRSLYPVNLDAKYQVDGMRIKFLWEEAKAKAPDACQNFEPVNVTEVTPVR